MAFYNALIRTHHITSRRKVAKLKKAFTASQNPGLRLVVLRVGASPGIMYAEGTDEVGVAGWVAEVQALRYKDFQLAARVGEADEPGWSLDGHGTHKTDVTGWREVGSVQEFADLMRGRGLGRWWRRAMGYEREEGQR